MIFDNDVITSRNNPTVKWAASLKDKKGRELSGAFIAEGEKLSYEAIKSDMPISHILVSEEKSSVIIPKLRALHSEGYAPDCRVIIVSDGAFLKISTENAPQGIISVIKHLDFFRKLDIIYKEEFLKNLADRCIFLSSVRDPLNLGAVIRSAVAFDVTHIILSDDCADVYSPRAIRAAMGSCFKVKVSYVKDIVGTVLNLREIGRRVFAAELTDGAISLGDIGLCSTDSVVIGNEGHGIDPSVSAACDNSVYIPISEATESLNASVAAAIFMWELSK